MHAAMAELHAVLLHECAQARHRERLASPYLGAFNIPAANDRVSASGEQTLRACVVLHGVDAAAMQWFLGVANDERHVHLLPGRHAACDREILLRWPTISSWHSRCSVSEGLPQPTARPTTTAGCYYGLEAQMDSRVCGYAEEV